MGERERGWRHLISALAILCAASFPIACGGDDEETVTSVTEATTGAAGATGATGAEPKQNLKVSETEYALDPKDPTVEAGPVTIEVTNDGKIAHTLEVVGASGEDELAQDLQPGQSGTLEVDLPQPGKYRWYCPISDHAERGMEGEITVKAGGSA